MHFNHTLYNQTPITSTNYAKLKASAKNLLTPEAYDYAAGDVGLIITVAANRAAFDRWHILPSVMHLITLQRSLTATLFNRTVPTPLVMAPVGVHTLFHPTGERATAAVFGQEDLPYTQHSIQHRFRGRSRRKWRLASPDGTSSTSRPTMICCARI